MIAAVLLILSFTPFTPVTAAGAILLYQFCGTGSYYTDNSTYLGNLKLLSPMLIKNASANPSPFSMGSFGAVPDTVYGLFLCRGDVGAFDCSRCAATGFQDARIRCSFNKDATLFYDQCLIRFSNEDFLDHLNPRDRDREVQSWTPGIDVGLPGSNFTAIAGVVRVLLQETARQAAFNSTWRYATGRMDVSSIFLVLYSLSQCVPDFTPGDCWECLNNISDTAVSLFRGEGEYHVLGVPCSMRYSTSKFYEGEPMWRIMAPADAFAPQDAVRSPKHNKPVTKVLVIALVATLFVLFISVIVSFRTMRRHMKAKMNVHEDEALIWGLEGRNPEFTIYDFSQVLEATGNFSDDNKLGQGGFGPVYKGRFPDGLEIAVKRLASHSGQGLTEFKNEIQLIAKLQHTNLVRLLGCCYKGQEKLLIYEYLPNKSLDFFIFDETRRALLDWNKRLAIIDGIAQGLLYLHKHSRLRVIHRDLKAGNILLDCEMNPKISDFGLAKIFNANDNEGNTKRIAGTYGYMAPEYALEGLFSIKSDVFSFGVLTLEIISGKRISNFHRYGDFINPLGHVWQMWKDETWLQLVDASLVTESSHTLQMMRCINIALLCVQENAADRPTMSEVNAMLSSMSMTLLEPKHPAFFHMRVTNEEPSSVVVASSANGITLSAVDGR